MVKNVSKLSKSAPKLFKMVQHGPKWYKMIRHFQNGLIRSIFSKMVQNSAKSLKKGPKRSTKKFQNDPVWSKFI